MFYKKYLVPVLILFLLAFWGQWFYKFDWLPHNSVQVDIEQIYNRYSNYLDTVWNGTGWQYNVPSKSYNEINKISSNYLRQQVTFATFYRFRNDAEAGNKIHRALAYALVELPKKQVNFLVKNGEKISTRSFNEAIGLFLSLRLLETRSDLFTEAEKQIILQNIKAMYPWVLQANDTENRSLLGAAYSLAILNHPLLQFTAAERDEYLILIRKKISIGLLSIDSNGVYREGEDSEFTPHYHLVSADMLSYLGGELKDDNYLNLAHKMHLLIYKKYPQGQVNSLAVYRPTGVGLQTVLLRSVSQYYLKNPLWYKYWEKEKVGLGFIDPNFTNRLVWQDTVDNSFNDDYSLANMAELFWDKLR